MTASILYFTDHSHSCACGGWRHEAPECEYSQEHPCPLCDLEEGLTPCTSGTKLGADPFDGHVSLVGSEEVFL
jgi:hypothetical protein